VINNADRKSGHCLIGSDHRLWAIDHGVCFHTEYKLRTVIWEFSGEPIDAELLQDLRNLYELLAENRSDLSKVLHSLLDAEERDALSARVRILLHTGEFPAPLVHRRNYPWPPI
jgi:uncharacterized repeat protein (TIGR03843 family)